MPTKVLALHHVSARPRLPVGPDASCRLSPAALRACLETHDDWECVDYRRGLDPARAGRRSLVITFDDGYLDTLTEALPVLEACAAPCLVFVVPGYLDRAIRPMESDLGWIASHGPGPEEGRRLYAREHRRLRRSDPRRQGEALRRLAARFDLPYPPPRDDVLLTWEQVAELNRHPLVTIGAHTMTHTPLGPLSGRRSAREAAESRARLEDRLGGPVECFAFPYGRSSPASRRAVAAAGYRFAFTTRPAVIDRLDRLDPMAVPRFVVDGAPAS